MGISSWNAWARFDGFICVPEWAVYRVKTGIAGGAKYGEKKVKSDEELKE
jgi:hypothetical protein